LGEIRSATKYRQKNTETGMPKVSLAFFSIAPIYVLIGMAGGIYMGASEDHTLAPVHAHLNLIGFMMMSVMGTFYALAGDKASSKLAWANFWVLNLALVVMIPMLALVVLGNKSVIPILGVSEILAVLAVLIYLAAIVQVWRHRA
jgi:hypothetical protein